MKCEGNDLFGFFGRDDVGDRVGTNKSGHRLTALQSLAPWQPPVTKEKSVSPNWSAKTSRLLQLLACCCGSPFKVKGVSENDQFMRISLFSFTKENEKPSLAKAFLCLH